MNKQSTHPLFGHGNDNEQSLLEDLIIESLHHYGINFFYIPRTLVSKDDILGEDRLSEFKSSYPIEMYFENVESFGGQQFYIQKFGMMVEQTATLVVARRRWKQLIGRYGETIIPTRPNEGDLIYFPLSNGMFEIKFVDFQNPFYQLGKLYTYKLEVELFQYSSERINTGIPEIDVFESLKSFDEEINPEVEVPSNYGRNNNFLEAGQTIINFDERNPFGDLPSPRPPVSIPIFTTGIWNDLGKWSDLALWNDGDIIFVFVLNAGVWNDNYNWLDSSLWNDGNATESIFNLGSWNDPYEWIDNVTWNDGV